MNKKFTTSFSVNNGAGVIFKKMLRFDCIRRDLREIEQGKLKRVGFSPSTSEGPTHWLYADDILAEGARVDNAQIKKCIA